METLTILFPVMRKILADADMQLSLMTVRTGARRISVGVQNAS
jgi:hypothetical protein